MLEYVTEQLIEDVAHELASGEPDRLLGQPLVTATAKDDVRRSQDRLIAAPLVERLVSPLDKRRGRPMEGQGYGPATSSICFGGTPAGCAAWC